MALEKTNRNDDDSSDRRPVPDPTRLTTEQLYREIGSLKEIVFTRLDGMDRALTLATESITRQPTEIEKAVGHLKDMLGARMNGMDVLREEKFGSIKESVEKAMASAKEAIAEQNRASDLATLKSETNFTKQIDQMGGIIQGQAKNSDVQVSDIKERLNRLEGAITGKADNEKVHRDNTGLWIGLASALIAFAALAMGAIGLFIANYHKV